MDTQPIRTQVLIVGGGPVGLALSLELGSRGIHCCVIEQNERLGASQAPRSKMLNVRSMTHVRRWGLVDEIRRATPLPPKYPSDIIYATRLTGPEFARFENAFSTNRAGDDRFPDGAAWIPQYRNEDVFRDAAARMPSVTVMMGTRLLTFTQTQQQVEATIATAKGSQVVRADYIVGADGARSTVRSLAGIVMDEIPSASTKMSNISALIHAPGLSKLHKLGPAIIYHVVNGEVSAGMGPFDDGDRWFINAHPPHWSGDLANFDLVAYTRAVIGAPVPIEVLYKSTWAPRALLARNYSQGRVFLVGDASQVRPPTGGYGMNLGVCDAADLGWKLAATLQGWGGPGLLATYELERKPVHHRVLREALENYGFVDAIRNSRISLDDLELPGSAGAEARARLGALTREQKEREYHTLGVVLGDQYLGSPLVAAEPGSPPRQQFRDYIPSSYPGCLAPHLWISAGQSLYDLFGPGFTLIVVDRHGTDQPAFTAAAARLRIPLTIVELEAAAARDLYPTTLTLIRPDQHVAWRGNAPPEDLEGLLNKVRGGAATELESPKRVAVGGSHELV
jgi:2-polyprenyl-6-methoxyphenol hydroxylase-like FAD-dependent oxidoreductase